ncbi:hypothetical protein [Cellulomonas fimi]|nr:hypothetical protein [Cellulomonas fimi]
MTTGRPSAPAPERLRITADEFVALRRGLPELPLGPALDLDWIPGLAASDRVERRYDAIARLRRSGLVSNASVRYDAAGDADLGGVLTARGAAWWSVAADPWVTVEVTAWDRSAVRHGWYAVRGPMLVGLVRESVVAVAPVGGPGLTAPVAIDLEPVEMTIADAGNLATLVEELWPAVPVAHDAEPGADPARVRRPGRTPDPVVVDLVDGVAFLRALATGDAAVVDEVMAQAGWTRFPEVLRGLEGGVVGGLDLTVVSRPGGDERRTTGHWVLGTRGWRGLQVRVPSAVPGGARRRQPRHRQETGSHADRVRQLADQSQVRVTAHTPKTIHRTLAIGVTHALEDQGA